MSNVMATIQKVICTYPIDGADSIEMTQVLDYHVVTQKGEFNVGDLVVYAKVDSIFPDGMPPENAEKYKTLKKNLTKVTTEDERDQIQNEMNALIATNIHPEYEFLRGIKFRIKAKKYAKFIDKSGNPIISQGIIFGTKILPNRDTSYVEGEDVTSILSITKVVEDAEEVLTSEDDDVTVISNPLLRRLDTALMRFKTYRNFKRMNTSKKIKGTWADWMPPKSDEENIQNRYTRLYMKYGNQDGWVATEKMEGQSISFYLLTSKRFFGFKKTEHFGVCSRNVHMPTYNGTQFWNTAINLDVKNKLARVGKNIFVRGEQCGPGIQKNIYKFNTYRVFVYDVWDIDARRKYNYSEMIAFCQEFGFEVCPVLNDNYKLADSVQEMLADSNGKSVMGNVWREGIVLRRKDNFIESVKVKSPEYEIKKHSGSLTYSESK